MAMARTTAANNTALPVSVCLAANDADCHVVCWLLLLLLLRSFRVCLPPFGVNWPPPEAELSPTSVSMMVVLLTDGLASNS